MTETKSEIESEIKSETTFEIEPTFGGFMD